MPGPFKYQLTKAYTGPTNSASLPDGRIPYVLQLEPAILPNQEPRLLARDVVIDLTQDPNPMTKYHHSFIPASWTSPSQNLDIMFSPRGTVVGDAASAGLIHLLIGDADDVSAGRYPGAPNVVGDQRIVTFSPLTGNISTYQVVPTDPYDPDVAFSLAKQGGVAR
jgi:hypothetical protein